MAVIGMGGRGYVAAEAGHAAMGAEVTGLSRTSSRHDGLRSSPYDDFATSDPFFF